VQEIVNSTITTFLVFLPELVLCAVALLLIIFSLFKPRSSGVFYMAVAGLVIHAFILLTWPGPVVFKVIFTLAALVSVLISGKSQRMEFYLLIFSVLLGSDILISSANFIMIVLSMELISISSYVLTAGTDASKQRAEAAWKFFIYGSIATAVMIFGMSYLYGATGSLSFPAIHQDNNLFTIGGIMMLAGFLFKMTAAPFHLWAPDVYEATPSPIVAFLSVVPKLAAFLMIMPATLSTNFDWSILITVISIFTIAVGTFAALSQTNAKRMMAYSSVAQAGFLLAIPASFSDQVSQTSLPIYYAIVFAIMNYVVFIVIHEIEKSGKGAAYTNFAGIGYSSPFIAVCIVLGLVSLTGLPPMAGFMAKLFVFSSIWTKYGDTQNPIFLALFVVGLLATATSLYFYLRIPFYAFFRRSEENQTIKISPFTNLLLVILVGLLLTLFLAPGLFDGPACR